MSTFEYTAAFISILFGLAVADLLTSLHRLLRAGRRVRWDWLLSLVALLALVTILNRWWALYRWLGLHETLTLVGFMPRLASLLLLFLVVSAALPDEVPAEGRVDLRGWYEKNRRYFWSLFTLYLLTVTGGVVGERLARGDAPVDEGVAVNLVFLVLMVVLIFVRRRWLHGLVVVAYMAMLLVGGGSLLLAREPAAAPAVSAAPG